MTHGPPRLTTGRRGIPFEDAGDILTVVTEKSRAIVYCRIFIYTASIPPADTVAVLS